MKIRFTFVFIIMFLLPVSACTGTFGGPENNHQGSVTRPDPVIATPPGSITSVSTEQPEACNHFWKKPDCHNPSVCLDCGETQGSPIEHVWSQANYQEPPLCIHCGDIGGIPLEPLFNFHGFRINTTSGRPFNYRSVTDSDTSIATTGTITLLYIDIFESDTGYPVKPGYEYIVARFMINSTDENAKSNGFRVMTGQLDFFGFDPFEPAILYSDLKDSDIEGFKVANQRIRYFDDYYEYYIKHTRIQNTWVDDMLYLIIEYTLLVPAGYDGIVIYASDAGNWSMASNRVITDNFDNNTLFFRLKTQSG